MTGNLGNYQRMVQLAKAAHGPVRLGLYIAGGGFVAGAFVGAALKEKVGPAVGDTALTVVRAVKREPTSSKVFTVAADANGSDYTLRVGDRFRVLERDDDAVLIEVIDDGNNPYVLSGKLLESISDFTLNGEIGDK